MEMNSLLNDLNCGCEESCMEPACERKCGQGCGFGSWIWILLILLYCGKGNGYSNNYCGCEASRRGKCCCEQMGCPSNSRGSSSYLFLLVVLFLCNSNSSSGCGLENLFGGCC